MEVDDELLSAEASWKYLPPVNMPTELATACFDGDNLDLYGSFHGVALKFGQSMLSWM